MAGMGLIQSCEAFRSIVCELKCLLDYKVSVFAMLSRHPGVIFVKNTKNKMNNNISKRRLVCPVIVSARISRVAYQFNSISLNLFLVISLFFSSLIK